MRFTFRLLAAATAVALSVGAANAAPVVIDNFNQYVTPAGSGPGFTGWNPFVSFFGPAGNHVLHAPGSRTVSETGLSTSNVLGGTRQTSLSMLGISSSSSTPLEAVFGKTSTPGQDIFSLNQSNGVTGEVVLKYSFPGTPQSLTTGVSLDFVFLETGLLGYEIEVSDGSGFSTTGLLVINVTTTGTQTVSIPATAFLGSANLSNITDINLRFVPATSQDFGIDNFAINEVPEPASLAVFGVLALSGVAAVARRKLLARRSAATVV